MQPSKKRRRERAAKRVCYGFQRTGSCQYGDTCKFLHTSVPATNETETSEVALVGSHFPVAHDGSELYKPRSAEDRYFEHWYTDHENNEDLSIHLHSNGIALLVLAPYHPALDRTKRAVVKVDFISKGKPLFDFEVSGKKKKGGAWFDPDYPVCTIHCDDESVYPVKANIRARLFEVNKALMTKPELLYKKEGFFVVVSPRKDEIADIRSALISEESYLAKHVAAPSGS